MTSSLPGDAEPLATRLARIESEDLVVALVEIGDPKLIATVPYSRLLRTHPERVTELCSALDLETSECSSTPQRERRLLLWRRGLVAGPVSEIDEELFGDRETQE